MDDGRVTRVVESASGPVMAAGGRGRVEHRRVRRRAVLPTDPTGYARRCSPRCSALSAVTRLGVVLSDTSGRPWRVGQVDFALGAAGLWVLDDLRGAVDADGRVLSRHGTGGRRRGGPAADLVKGKVAAVPVALVRGVGEFVTGALGAGGRSLVRTGPGDCSRPVQPRRCAPRWG